MTASSIKSNKIVVCAGGPRVMGRLQGQQLRGPIHRAIEKCLADPSFQTAKPWWLPSCIFFALAKRKAERALTEPLRQDFPEMWARLQGFAEGAQVPLRDAVFLAALEALLASKAEESTSNHACSAVAVRGARSVTTEVMVGRNFDYTDVLGEFLILRDSRPYRKYRSWQLSSAVSLGAFDGMNERGLCITYNYGYIKPSEYKVPTGTISMAISETLERCSTVTEATEFLTSRPRWGGALLMLADATGDIAALEVSSTKSVLRRPSAGQDVLFHTNKFVSTTMAGVQVEEEAVYTDSVPPPFRGVRVHHSAEQRYARLAELLAKDRPMTVTDLRRIMGDHGTNSVPGPTTVCVHNAPLQSTLASFVFFPQRRKINVAFSHACEAETTSFEVGF